MTIQRQHIGVLFAVVLGMAVLLTTIGALGVCSAPAEAAGAIRYVATTGADTGACQDPSAPCQTIQYAVDQADAGDEVRVAAGVYTDINNYGGLAQIVYLSKTLDIAGGYLTSDMFESPPHPVAHPTVLDACRVGRGMVISGSITPLVSGLTVVNGDATGLGGGPNGRDAGGGLYVRAGAMLSGNIVLSNTAYSGSGIYITGWPVSLFGNVVCGNGSEGIGNGGGLYIDHQPSVVAGNEFDNNEAYQGGGVFLDHCEAALLGNEVTGNTAEWAGGAILVYGGSPVVEGNLVVRNGADRGGGILLYHDVGSELRRNVIISNIASDRAGGVYLSGSDGTLLDSNVVAQNQAGTVGSGVGVVGSSVSLSHNTIANNTGGDGTGVFVGGEQGSIVALKNTVLAGQQRGVYVDQGSSLVLDAVLWNSTSITVEVAIGANSLIDNQYTGIPDFVDPADGDYHIGLDSAARDRGIDSGTSYDIDGDPRPLEGAPDLGADEIGLIVTKDVSVAKVNPGEQVTYTIALTNATASSVHALVVDELPQEITPTEEILWWMPTIAPRAIWSQTFVVTLTPGYHGWVTNVVHVTSSEGLTGTAVATCQARYAGVVYLPLVVRGGERLRQ